MGPVGKTLFRNGWLAMGQNQWILQGFRKRI